MGDGDEHHEDGPGDVNPDSLFRLPNTTTFYFTRDGLLYPAPGDTAHLAMLVADDTEGSVKSVFGNSGMFRALAGKLDLSQPLFGGRLLESLGMESAGEGFDERGMFERGMICSLALMGRCDHDVVAIWNSPLQQELLAPCLQKLLAHGHTGPEAMVYASVAYGVPIHEVLEHGAADEDPEVARKMELAHQLHLMRGGEKRAAMKELGVGAGGSGSEHPMAKGLKSNNLLKPGQKWWAPQSESFASRMARL
jgi:hypothetical protein